VSFCILTFNPEVQLITVNGYKITFWVCLILSLCVLSFDASAPAWAKKPKIGAGERYKIIGDITKAKGRHPIEVVEYFNFSCVHCYRFLQNRGEEKLLNRFGNMIRFQRVPIYWGKQTPFPAMAYYLAEKHGKGVEVYRAIFEANFQRDLDVFDASVLNKILRDLGISTRINGEEWSRSRELRNEAKKGLRMADGFNVRETPTIVLNKVVKVMPKHTHGDMKQMIQRVEEAIIDLSH